MRFWALIGFSIGTFWARCCGGVSVVMVCCNLKDGLFLAVNSKVSESIGVPFCQERLEKRGVDCANKGVSEHHAEKKMLEDFNES